MRKLTNVILCIVTKMVKTAKNVLQFCAKEYTIKTRKREAINNKPENQVKSTEPQPVRTKRNLKIRYRTIKGII